MPWVTVQLEKMREREEETFLSKSSLKKLSNSIKRMILQVFN